MDQVLNHFDGVIGIADDGIVHGKDDEEHDRHLHRLIEMAHEQRHQHSSNSFLAWSHTYHHLCLHFHPWLYLFMNCLRRAQSSHGINYTRKPLMPSDAWSAQTLSYGTSMHKSHSHPGWCLRGKALMLFCSKMATQSSLPQSANSCRPLLCQTQSVKCLPVSLA